MKISRDTREIINTIIVLLVVAAIVVIYIIYPLNRSKAVMGRTDIDNYNQDSAVINETSTWIDAGLSVDTFSVEADGLATIAGLHAIPDSTVAEMLHGTVILVHSDGNNRDSVLPLAQMFLNSGYDIIAYDQRASGRSTGKYRGEGGLEGTDLVAVVAYLELREQISHPLTVIGKGLGGDAALLAALEDRRIDRVVAVEPFLTTLRMQDILKDRHDTYWFPFFRTMMWWWYEIRSGYAAEYRDLEQIKAVGCPTLIFSLSESFNDPEVMKIKELSDPQFLKITQTPPDDEALFNEALQFMME